MMEPSNNDGNCLPAPSSSSHPSKNQNTSSERLLSVTKDYGNEESSIGDCEGSASSNVGDESHEHGESDVRGLVSESDEENRSGEATLSLNELMYSAHSYHVISLPVSITMILAALSVTYINTPETIQQGEELMADAYHVWKVDSENDSTSKQLALDLANGLVIVTVIGTMTFGIVLLYKYRCMKVLIGYMMFSSGTLLGLLGMEVFEVAIEKYRIPIDAFSFYFGLYNFAVVGVTAIFYSNGIPPYITQGYLICSSVIIAWQLSHFDAISTWTLLIMLALYDLCAVLTPCGPLRALVNLMSDEDSPEMPGLLYEAEIPDGLRRPVMSGRRTGGGSGGNGEEDGASHSPPASMAAERYQQPSVSNPRAGGDSSEQTKPEALAENSVSSCDESTSGVELSSAVSDGRNKQGGYDSFDQEEPPMTPINNPRNQESSGINQEGQTERLAGPTTMIPLAIAKLYRLPLVSPPPPATTPSIKKGRARKRNKRPDQSSNVSTSPLLPPQGTTENDPPTNPAIGGASISNNGDSASSFVITNEEYNPAQLRTVVEAILPRNGANIVKQPRRALPGDREDRYGIIGSDGILKRILFVDRSGKVYEEVNDDDDSEYEGRFSNTIKLGLGDFIFYSVLVAKSAQYSFPCFVSSFLVILAGLGGTLVLLAVYKHALPALPISIFLAVTFYVLTRFMIEPWIRCVMNIPFYV